MATPTIRETLKTVATTAQVSVTTGAATAAGDLLVAIHQTYGRAASELVAPTGTAGTWTEIGFAQNTGNTWIKLRGWQRRVTTAGAQTVTAGLSTGAAAQTTSLIVLVIPGTDSTAPIDGTPAVANGTSGASQAVGPTSPTSPDALLIGSWGNYNNGTYTAPATMTERAENNYSANNAHMAATQALTAAGATGTRAATIAASASWAALLFAVQGPTATAPTVNAGADATIDQYVTFARTATESDGGAAITARSWTVVSGPNQVGATIGTAAALSWAPTVGGTYTLRYSATNSVGTGTDDVIVTVNTLNFPVTAPMRLTATRTGTKQVTGTRAAPLRLTATRTGTKQVTGTRAAPLRLAATATGKKINIASATIRLTAKLLTAGSPRRAFVTAPLKLTATASTTGGRTATRAAALRLTAARAGTSARTGARTAPLKLTAGRAGTKAVGGGRAAAIRLAAAVTAVQHAGTGVRLAALRLAATVGGRFHTGGRAVTAVLRLTGTPATSSVRFNQATASTPLRLHAVVFAQRIVAEAQGLRPRADTTVKYELVAIARVPQVTGPPMFLEVDPVDWTDLTWAEALGEAPTLSASVKVDSLTEPILQRLRTPHEMPTELWLNRNGRRVFAGPLLGGRVSAGGDALSLEAAGLATYMQWMYVVADRNFSGTDQFAIVAALIDQWQALEYGHFGIDTAQAGLSGVLRTIAYPAAELHKVADRVADLAKLADGFDLVIDPTSRQLELYSPTRGVDRSTGEDAIVFDQRNVTSSDIVFSVAPADLASDGLGTGTASGSAAPLVSRFANLELRARFGRTGITATFSTGDQGALDAGVQALVQARDKVLLIPGPNARVSLDADLGSWDVGDSIGFHAHARLTASGAFRTRKRTVRVAETGTESVAVEFV